MVPLLGLLMMLPVQMLTKENAAPQPLILIVPETPFIKMVQSQVILLSLNMLSPPAQ